MGLSHFSKKEMKHVPKKIPCKDHLGNEFPSINAMCKHYGIDRTVFNYRRNEKHMSLKETLTMPVEKQHKGSCKDHLGNEFPNKKAMCKHYGISESAFSNRTKNNASIEEALGIIPYICFKTKNLQLTQNLFVKEVKSKNRKTLYAICIYNSIETLLTHDEIIEIYRNETRNAP